MLAPFLVPFGADPAGRIIGVDDADPAQVYRCPACQTDLVLKAGLIRRRHFAHRAEANCSAESALHVATKRRIVQAVRDWRTGEGPRPVVRRRCDRCRMPTDRPLSDRAVDAGVEHRLPSGRVLDVAVLDTAGSVMLAIEVLVTHAVSAEKAATLGDLSWLELRAEAVADAAVWEPVFVGGRLPVNVCVPCQERPLRRQRTTAAVCARYGFPAPAPAFVAVETRCWKCHRPTPIFFWPGIGVGRAAPEPWPRTVRMRFSRTLQTSYLANGCVHCDALQGDFFLEEILFSGIGSDADFDELHRLFFSPENDAEAEWFDRSHGLSIEEAVNLVVPPARPWSPRGDR